MCGGEDATTLHSKLYCVVCQKSEDRICVMKYFLCAWITGSGNQKLAMSCMDHAILSIVSFINDCMYLCD